MAPMQGGVARAEIQLHTIIDAGDGIVFAPDEGSRGVISNVHVSHLTATNVSTTSYQPSAASC